MRMLCATGELGGAVLDGVFRHLSNVGFRLGRSGRPTFGVDRTGAESVVFDDAAAAISWLSSNSGTVVIWGDDEVSIDLTILRWHDDVESQRSATPVTHGFDELLISGRIRDLQDRNGPMSRLVESLPSLDASIGTAYSIALSDDMIEEQLGSWDIHGALAAGRLPPLFGWRITVPAVSRSLVESLSTAADEIDGCRLVRRREVVSLDASNDPMQIPWGRIGALKRWAHSLEVQP